MSCSVDNDTRIKDDKGFCKRIASAGNRTRVTRVAGENSTTEPPMLTYIERRHLVLYRSQEKSRLRFTL